MRYAKAYNKNEYGKYLESLPLHLLSAEWDNVTSLFRALKRSSKEEPETKDVEVTNNEGIEQRTESDNEV